MKNFLVTGIINKNPTKSVKNPGIIRSKAAKANAAPDIISYIGILFFTNRLKPDLIAFKPSNLAKYTPVIAVKKIKKMVFKAPIIPPILIIKYISIKGVAIIKRITTFICLIIYICILYHLGIIIKTRMSNQFGFIDIILLVALAAFIILRLRNILGRKTGYQGKPMNKRSYKNMEALKDKKNDEAIKTKDIEEQAKEQFLKGAGDAYEQIITFFAKGDKKSLKSLLGERLFNDFSEVIDNRKKKELKYETTFIGLKSSKILEFKKIENIYKITVNFVSEIITCVRDKNNQIIEGNPDIIKTVNDVWKFKKNMWNQDPAWYLVETSNK